ncbi:hypothetical protein GPECTOR_58g568 [Gonium pectorale]|uniref:Uncharacterized protein n=1 Tax=Gonium pectorale TaxID=33097 RepID=A0A150G5G0_GONPE|nr:hypothetical protein GPECTOR_58g568 [Gonium pectorale]|eukprot:KXZ45119.1 hypothetical protein GPECTOR_58g568 [Gonium pectorale]
MVGSWMSVHDGFWGEWKGHTYPCSKYAYNEDKGAMELTAMPINSFQLRVEPIQPGNGDDTALNGIR